VLKAGPYSGLGAEAGSRQEDILAKHPELAPKPTNAPPSVTSMTMPPPTGAVTRVTNMVVPGSNVAVRALTNTVVVPPTKQPTTSAPAPVPATSTNVAPSQPASSKPAPAAK
jgi:hypothetical protein